MPDERPDDPAPGGWLPPTGGDEPVRPPAAAPDGWLPPSDASYTPPPADPYPPQPAAPPAKGTSPWPGQAAPPVPYGGGGGGESHGKATASLALSVVGLFLCPVVFSVAGIVLGKQAQSDMDAQPARYGNRGQANWGVNLGWVGFVLGLVVIGLAIAGVPILPE